MKRFIYMIFILTCSIQLQAQENNQQKLEALRIAFFTKQLDLSTEDAQRFWPVYNNYQQDLQNIVTRQRNGQIKPDTYNQEMSRLRTHYRDEFVKSVGQAKFNKLLNAEREWGQMLKKEIERRGGNNKGYINKGQNNSNKGVGPSGNRSSNQGNLPSQRGKGNNQGKGKGNN